MSSPFTFQLPMTGPASNSEIPAQYAHSQYNPQHFSPLHSSQTFSPYHGQTTMLYPNQSLNESDSATFFGQHNVSYPDSPATNALSPDYSPQHNLAISPFQQSNMSGQNTVGNLGGPYFPQPDQSSQLAVSPIRQDQTIMRTGRSQRPQYNPTAAPFSTSNQNMHSKTISFGGTQEPNTAAPRGMNTFHLARPPARRVQHSPPRRAFHESSSPPRTPQTFRDIVLRDRLKALQDRRKQALENFCFSGEKVKFSQKELDDAWDSDVADQHLNDLFIMQSQLTALTKQHDEYGKEWKKLGDDIDELFGDLMVPGESKVQ